MRDYTNIYMQFCNCAGPQPSLTNPRADEHLPDCPYRSRVEADAITITTVKDSSDEQTKRRELRE